MRGARLAFDRGGRQASAQYPHRGPRRPTGAQLGRDEGLANSLRPMWASWERNWVSWPCIAALGGLERPTVCSKTKGA